METQLELWEFIACARRADVTALHGRCVAEQLSARRSATRPVIPCDTNSCHVITSTDHNGAVIEIEAVHARNNIQSGSRSNFFFFIINHRAKVFTSIYLFIVGEKEKGLKFEMLMRSHYYYYYN